MILHLRDKKVIFFDVGYTLDMPASGDWMFTNRFLQEAGDKLKTLLIKGLAGHAQIAAKRGKTCLRSLILLPFYYFW